MRGHLAYAPVSTVDQDAASQVVRKTFERCFPGMATPCEEFELASAAYGQHPAVFFCPPSLLTLLPAPSCSPDRLAPCKPVSVSPAPAGQKPFPGRLRDHRNRLAAHQLHMPERHIERLIVATHDRPTAQWHAYLRASRVNRSHRPPPQLRHPSRRHCRGRHTLPIDPCLPVFAVRGDQLPSPEPRLRVSFNAM